MAIRKMGTERPSAMAISGPVLVVPLEEGVGAETAIIWAILGLVENFDISHIHTVSEDLTAVMSWPGCSPEKIARGEHHKRSLDCLVQIVESHRMLEP